MGNVDDKDPGGADSMIPCSIHIHSDGTHLCEEILENSMKSNLEIGYGVVDALGLQERADELVVWVQ